MINLEVVPEFYRGYVSNVKDKSIVVQLIQEGDDTLSIFKRLSPQQVEYRYAEGKWAVKELLAHMIDAERVFAYRALCFARNEKKILHGFDEEMYSKEMNIQNRSILQLINEFANVRASTVDLFTGFSDEMLKREGNVDTNKMSVEMLGYIIIGHEIHHKRVLKEKYEIA